MHRLSISFGLTLLLFVCTWVAADAQATRTWVSGVGDDANPCSRTAPCLTFSGALGKTAAGGEIDVLDPGDFGPLTITKAVTIDGALPDGGIQATGASTQVVVNAGASDVVILRRLSIQGDATGTSGVKFNTGSALFVEGSVVSGFPGATGHGVDFEPNASAALFVTNSVIRNNGGSGVYVKAGAGTGTATIDGSRLESNAVGVNARDRSKVVVRRSVVASNGTAGLQAQGDAAAADMDVEDSVVILNGVGIQSSGNGMAATVRISNTTILDNTTGIAAPSPGIVWSFLDNRIAGNGTDGAPNVTPTPLPTATPLVRPTTVATAVVLQPTQIPTFVPTPDAGVGGEVVLIPTAVPSATADGVVINAPDNAPFPMTLLVPPPTNGQDGQLVRMQEATAVATTVPLPTGVAVAKVVQIDVYDSATGDLIHDHIPPLVVAIQLSSAEKAICAVDPSRIALLHVESDGSLVRIPLVSLDCNSGILVAKLFSTTDYLVATLSSSSSVTYRALVVRVFRSGGW